MWWDVAKTVRPNALFLFPDSSELRHVRRLPRPGARMRSESGAVWVVAEVLQSGVDSYTVRCVAPNDSLGAMKDLASSLLDRARRSASLAEMRRRRRERG